MTNFPYEKRWHVVSIVVAIACTLFAWTALDEQDKPIEQEEPTNVLLFSKTVGFRHGSIAAGVQAIEKAAKNNNMSVVATEDATVFNGNQLASVDVIVFLNTTGDVLNEKQQEAMEQFIQGGGGWVGIHAAADTEYDWPWYGKLMGAYFAGHPAVQRGRVVITDQDHPAMSHLPENWERVDEWYDYRSVPEESVTILATLDESTYEGGGMGDTHPIAWCHEYDGGRAFYTGGGHTDESFEESDFIQHIIAAIQWAAEGSKKKPANIEPSIESTPNSGHSPLTVRFVATCDTDAQQEYTYAWDFTADGEIDSRAQQTYWTFHKPGSHLVRLFVTGEQDDVGATDAWIVVGNTRPTLQFISPPDGGVIEPDQWLQYDVLVEDAEETSPAIERVVIELYQSGDLGGKPVLTRTGSSGRVKIPAWTYPERNRSQSMFLLARYLDQGHEEKNHLIGHSMVLLRAHDVMPNLMQSSDGLKTTQIEGTDHATAFVAEDGMWVSLDPLALAGIEDIAFLVKPNIKSHIEIRRNEPDGPLVSVVQVPAGNEQTEWIEVIAAMGDPGGTHPYFFVFGGPSDRSLFLMRSLRMRGPGVSSPGPESSR